MEQTTSIQALLEEFGADNVEYDPFTRHAKIAGIGIVYVPKRISVRHKLIASLKAQGRTTKAAVELLNGKGASAMHANKVMKNPVMARYTESEMKDIVGDARETLVGAVQKAASNVANLVEAGDYSASVKVLAGTGVLVSKSEKEVKLPDKFGAWLAAEQKAKEISFYTDGATEAEIVEPEKAPEPEKVEVLFGPPDTPPPDTMPIFDKD